MKIGVLYDFVGIGSHSDCIFGVCGFAVDAAEVIAFLKGCAPVLAAFVGLICLFIGAADVKDRNEARKEELEARARDAAENK